MVTDLLEMTRACEPYLNFGSTSSTIEGVLQTFLRGGLNFQRIRDRAVESESHDLWRDPEP